MVPRVERECRKKGGILQRFRRDADVGLAVEQHRGNLSRAALVQHKMDLGKVLGEARHHMRQHVARLRVRGGDSELPLVAIAELLAEPLDIGRIDEYALDHLDQLLAWVGQSEQPLAAPHEQLDAQLVFQILDVLADTRLRREQHVGDLGQVEIAPDGLANDAQLLKVHRCAPSGSSNDGDLFGSSRRRIPSRRAARISTSPAQTKAHTLLELGLCRRTAARDCSDITKNFSRDAGASANKKKSHSNVGAGSELIAHLSLAKIKRVARGP